jgi:voltage-gated potassium channel
MHWFVITIIAGWGNVDPVTFFGTVLVILTQILSIALAAILTGVVATAYTAQVERPKRCTKWKCDLCWQMVW